MLKMHTLLVAVMFVFEAMTSVARAQIVCDSDSDMDGYQSCTDTSTGDDLGPDCEPEDPDVHPGAKERCNFLDDDCDGKINEDLDCGIIIENGTLVGGGCDCNETNISNAASLLVAFTLCACFMRRRRR